MLYVKTFVFNPIMENTYLLYDETKEAAIIDCGASTANENQRLSGFIQENGLTVKRLLNTHLHFDHVLGNYFVFKTYGLKPEYHPNEERMPGLKEQSVFLSSPIRYEPVLADRYIEDNDEIVFGNTTLKALLTPGHSPGSLSFYSEKDRYVFTGDALFHHDIGRSDLWGGNYQDLIRSIRENLFTLPEDTVVYPGHEEPTTIGEEKLHNPHVR